MWVIVFSGALYWRPELGTDSILIKIMLKMLMEFFKSLLLIVQLSSFEYYYRIASRGESLFILANLAEQKDHNLLSLSQFRVCVIFSIILFWVIMDVRENFGLNLGQVVLVYFKKCWIISQYLTHLFLD